MRIHIISTGGAIMHQLAISLKQQGYQISGSDDEIYDPSKTTLEKHGLLPEKMGWDKSRIHKDLDAVIIGMHAKPDNPELDEARLLGLRIFSYPEFIYEVSKNKTRIVIGGSHGKTTTTSMIMHILKENSIEFDYLVGARVEGFEYSVRLTDAPIIVIEGDEYLSSPIDRSSKFLHYKPHYAVLTGIAWDHINVFPSLASYEETFATFIDSLNSESKLYYYKEPRLSELVGQYAKGQTEIYESMEFDQEGLLFEGNRYEMEFFGRHNYSNLQAAYHVCKDLGLKSDEIIEAAQSFRTPDKRMNFLLNDNGRVVIRDFAHAPSKVKATVEAVRDKYKEYQLFVLLELHTYSSLNRSFLPLYKGTLEGVDEAVVSYSLKTLEIKKLASIEESYMEECFDQENLRAITDPKVINQWLDQIKTRSSFVLLIMSSGHLAGLNIDDVVAGN